MTGYGKATADVTGRRLILEIRSLNSKQMDLTMKTPSILRERESEFRSVIGSRLERGKVELFVATETAAEQPLFSVNKELALRYRDEIAALSAALGAPEPADLVSMVMKMPDVMQGGREELSDDDREAVTVALNTALDLLDQFRAAEGETLGRDMAGRVETILALLDRVGPLEEVRMRELREKMMRDFARYGQDPSAAPADRNRFEQELIYYLEKLDVTEEKVRLRKHCRYFLDTMEENGSQGKKLGFISQEMGREINTLGSKASDAAIQKIVVEMKDELEKIKEQLGNVL